MKNSLERIKTSWLENQDYLPEDLKIHENWYHEIREKHKNLNDDTIIKNTLRDEVGHVFAQVLNDSGVFKRNPEGFAAFDKFSESVINNEQ